MRHVPVYRDAGKGVEKSGARRPTRGSFGPSTRINGKSLQRHSFGSKESAQGKFSFTPSSEIHTTKIAMEGPKDAIPHLGLAPLDSSIAIQYIFIVKFGLRCRAVKAFHRDAGLRTSNDNT